MVRRAFRQQLADAIARVQVLTDVGIIPNPQNTLSYRVGRLHSRGGQIFKFRSTVNKSCSTAIFDDCVSIKAMNIVTWCHLY